MAFKKGLFDLTAFESKSDDDILGLNITEGSDEFDCNDPACSAGGDFDKDATAAKRTSISVPGKVTLSADTYNAALKALQNSFKEAAGIIDAIQNATISDSGITTGEVAMGESAVDEALLEAYEDGPYFESVNRADKDDVKKIVKSLRPKIEKMMDKSKVKFYKPNLVARALTGILIPEPMNLSAWIDQIWKTRLWQVLGVMIVEEGNIKDLTDKMTQLYADELGEYKILYANAPMAFVDMFRLKFGWKNTKKCYFIMVDKKMDKEVTAAIKEMEKAIKEKEAQAKSTDDSSNKSNTADTTKLESAAIQFLQEMGETELNVVSRSDKGPVKAIVEELRPKMMKLMDDADIKFYKPNLVARAILGEPAAWKQIWSTRLWQVLGIACIEAGNIDGVVAKLNEIYSTELGDYKIIFEDAPPAFLDVFRTKFNYKNTLRPYFLLVDSKDSMKGPSQLDKLSQAADKSSSDPVQALSIAADM